MMLGTVRPTRHDSSAQDGVEGFEPATPALVQRLGEAMPASRGARDPRRRAA